MKLRANYKYMDTCMPFGLVMFQIEDQPVVFMFSFGNGVVSWSSKKQPTIALLNIEA